MDITGNTILITGGATGIGLCLAQAFLENDNTVLVCGRREEKLKEAKARLPLLEVMRADVSSESERESLAKWAIGHGVNILVNNAGMQRQINFMRGVQALTEGDNEVRCNLEGPVYLSARLIPHLAERKNAAIVNVSSGLGFVPIAVMPVYCATKAALHSFSVSLRHQLAKSGIRVFEIIPPTVNTDLDRGARAQRGQADRGIPPEDVAAAVLQAMKADTYEVPVAMAQNLVAGSRANFDEIFRSMNSWR